tara:strand:+ start:4332 stop:4820 length:489 start_codon:yes stop_codon:yes gene_type:complete
MKLNRKTFLCTDKQIEMIKFIQEKDGLKSMTSVFDMALKEYYKKSSGYGKDPLMDGSIGTNDAESLEVKAKRKAAAKAAEAKAVEDLRLQPKKDMCINDLKGEVVEQPNGSLVCEWQTHGKKNSEDQTIPLNQVGEYLLQNLYIPSKTAVLKARPELKAKHG